MTTATPSSSSSILLWPPPTCTEVQQQPRVDLLALIPPNQWDDANLPNREQHVADLILRPDRVIMDRVRYSDCERQTQHKLSDDIQASCREQGHLMSVKEWADKNQNRGTLRLRLRCRSQACRFQFQLNWDSKAEFWYISRRRCGNFEHTCRTVQGASQVSGKRHLADSNKNSNNKGPANKRAKLPEGKHKKKNEFKQQQSSSTANKNKAQDEPVAAVFDALDSARSLLDLSKAPSSPEPGSPTNEENQKPKEKASPVSVVSSPSQEALLQRLAGGDRLFLPLDLLSTQQKLALLNGTSSSPSQQMMEAALKAALQQRRMALAPTAPGAGAGSAFQGTDPRVMHTGLLLNGGAYASI